MKKVSAVLLFVALLAPVAASAAGPAIDDETSFLQRVAKYFGLRAPGTGNSAPAAPPAASARTPLGPGGPCVCGRPGTDNLWTGTITIDPSTGAPACDCCLGGLQSPDRKELGR